MKNNHEYYEMLISRYKDNDLNADEIFEMEKHLSSCKSCQRFKDELDSMSSMLLGNKPIVVHKKNIFNKNKIIASISSIAAALILFVGISAVNNNNKSNIISSNGEEAKIMASDFYNDTSSNIDYSMNEEDYVPLSSYFSYNENEENNNSESSAGEIEIMSAYIYYMAK